MLISVSHYLPSVQVTLTKTPLTQPNLTIPPFASFAAKAAASSAADGSSPLVRPSSKGSWQPEWRRTQKRNQVTTAEVKQLTVTLHILEIELKELLMVSLLGRWLFSKDTKLKLKTES